MESWSSYNRSTWSLQSRGRQLCGKYTSQQHQLCIFAPNLDTHVKKKLYDWKRKYRFSLCYDTRRVRALDDSLPEILTQTLKSATREQALRKHPRLVR
jgi:hypothetical protein